MQCAVIDIGSNSMRLTVYDAEKTVFKILFKEKIMAGLAGYVENGMLSHEGIECACQGLIEFKERLRLLNIQNVSVFFFFSLRNISNTQEALLQIYSATGFSLEVISGKDEAFYGFTGAMLDLSLSDGIFVDIGGASTEIASFAEGRLMESESYPIGSLRLYEDCVKNILPGKGSRERMKKRIEAELGHCKISSCGSSLACVGGTARAVLKLGRRRYHLPDSCRTLSTEQLESLYDDLCRGDRRASELILKIAPERIHTLLPGMSILCFIAQNTKVSQMTVSKYGVREGFLCQRIQTQL